MANELMKVEFESLSGISVKLDAETVRNTLARGNGKITDQEVAMFLRTCQAKKLDPLENGEVYLIKYDDKVPAQLVVGCHAYIRRADHFPDYRGFKAGITVIRGNGVEPIQKEGACVYKALGEQLIGGWCRVFRERSNGYVEETFVEVDFDEYSTGKSNWNAKPATMIRKVAISQAFRAAFPNEYEGLYTVDEMQASGAIPGNYRVVEGTGEVIDVEVDDPKISQEQRQSMFSLAKEHLGKDANSILKKLISDLGYESTNGMPVSIYNKVVGQIMQLAEERRSDNDPPEPVDQGEGQTAAE
ncbi:phage recombination protein Bet [Anaerotruncus colihominis]|uniref:phage recombination protein Bet n=1 Tax=Anaerotruncus colihominis TaxID=169435 RepID=UPI002431494C|nr:phage recombination protein Bet [Anaerotruncus colihominis]